MGIDLREKAAGLMCVGLAATHLDDCTKRLLDVGVSGVLLYQNRLDRPDSVARLIHSIKAYAGRRIFVAVDHEGAHRSRLQKGFTRFPEAEALGRENDVELALTVGRILGRELRAVGVDLTLGPVLDIATNVGNRMMKGRAIASDPELVARMGAALVEGQQSEGVAACGKHFPGHGDTDLDSNDSLPILSHGVARLEEVELKPFVAAINKKLAGILVGHLLFQELDPALPASLSRAIIFGLLRQRLAYRGFLMIDDVDMAALRERFSSNEIAIRGVASGADCFLCARRPDSAHDLIAAIERGVDEGSILPERIEAARRRTASLVHRYVQDPGVNPDLSVVGHPGHMEQLSRVAGEHSHLFPALCDEV